MSYKHHGYINVVSEVDGNETRTFGDDEANEQFARRTYYVGP